MNPKENMAVFLSHASQDGEADSGILTGGIGGKREVALPSSTAVLSVASCNLSGLVETP
jgi:hypothetical protein